MTTALAMVVIPLLSSESRALSISDYSPEMHNRFSSGFTTLPIANTHGNFVGAGFDLSGVGWLPGTGIPGTGRSRNFTLITPLHMMQARHYPSGTDSRINFLAADGTLHSNTLLGHATVNTGTYGNDLSVGTFATSFSADHGVATYRVLDVRSSSVSRDLGGLSLLIYGSQGDGTGPQLAFATASAAPFSLANVQTWSGSGSGTALQWQGGDSGGPAFVRYTAPDGSTTLTYAGPAYVPNGFTTLLPQDRFNWSPPDGINAITKTDGYAIKWTIYDNPADTVRTAPQWTGAASSGLSNAGNWSQSGAPAGLSVLFDASAANGITTLALDSDLTLRGALFKASASTDGFIFGGTGTLRLGYTGLRNESTATQTFNIPIVLTGSQNWEAAGGNFIFNGSIDTTADAHLLVVGGARDTIFNGALTGAGALAKDDTGVLTLNAHNTYAGNTWIHNGTLRLGTGSLPSNTTVIFDTTNPAALDLAGHHQTLAGLKSTHGGTGEIRLGGATLTLNFTDTHEFTGNITGTGNLNKTGTGVSSLGGVNTYAGTTTITAGVVRLATCAFLRYQHRACRRRARTGCR
jgi:autotransporter-associated beta strand protein